MIHTLSLLADDEVARIYSDLVSPQSVWVDASETAGALAAKVKQVERAIGVEGWLHLLRDRLFASIEVLRACFPLRISLPMICRYSEGGYYGPHVDAGVIQGIRADLACTIFLNQYMTDYEGGRLCIGKYEDERINPLNAHSVNGLLEGCAGNAVIYPATTLHKVQPVTKGTRIVVVCWIQSKIRQQWQREILYDLGRCEREISSREGKTAEVDLITKTYCNLMREWVEL